MLSPLSPVGPAAPVTVLSDTPVGARMAPKGERKGTDTLAGYLWLMPRPDVTRRIRR